MNARSIVIVATLGPRADQHDTVRALRQAGADLARINASHVDEDELQRLLQVAAAAGFGTDHVLADLQGGKTRLGSLERPIAVQPGQRLALATDPAGQGLPVDRPTFLQGLVDGDRLRVDDGRLLFTVQLDGGTICLRAETKGQLRSRAGLALLGGAASQARSLVPRDRRLLRAARRAGVQRFAISYACRPALLRHARQLALECAPQLPLSISAKLEHPQALERWQELATQAEELWLCRGDLGAEVGLRKLPALQHRLLERASAHCRLFLAGQLLHHTTVSPRPTRSEVCHLADLVRQGVAGFVLSDETAIGPHGPQAVRWLRSIADETLRELQAHP